MSFLGSAQSLVVLILGVAALGLELWALVDALRRRADAFVAAGKLTKPIWSVILVVATALGFVSIYSPLSFIALIGVVAAGIYLADVRPALNQVTGKGGGRSGPYGPW